MTAIEQATRLIDEFSLIGLQQREGISCALIAAKRTVKILEDLQKREGADEFWAIENLILEEKDIIIEIQKK